MNRAVVSLVVAGAVILALPPLLLAEPASAPGLAQILQANESARGGLAAWRGIQTLVQRGHIEHGELNKPRGRHAVGKPDSHELEEPVPFMQLFKRPHRMRLEMELGDLKAVQVFDGEHGIIVQPSPKGPQARPFSAGENAAAAEQVDPEGPLLDAQARGTQVTLEGTETVEGRNTYRLKLLLSNGATRHIWLDAETYLDVKLDGVRVIDGREWPLSTYFYDWKTAPGGLRLPGRIESAVGDTRASTRIIVERIFVNQPLSDAMFALPQRSAAATGSVVAPPAAPGPDSARAPQAR